MSLPDVIRFENRQKAVRIAQDFLAGRVRLVDAAEQLTLLWLWRRVDVEQTDPDFVTFVLIHDDATDGHRQWTAEALDAEYRDEAVEAASNLVK